MWIRQTAAIAAVRVMVEHLGEREVLPVKGVLTARTLYADTSERTIADVDLRVRVASLPAVLELARARGLPTKHVRAYDTVVFALEGVEVDVEAHVGPFGMSGLTIDAMLARAHVRDDVFGFPCAIAELHDHALLMAVNAFKDKLVLQQKHSENDLRLIGRQAGFDPERLARLARDVGSSALVWIVADFLEEEPAWRAVRAALGARPPRAAYARLFRLLAARAPSSLATRVLARMASDDPWMRLQALLRAARFEAGR